MNSEKNQKNRKARKIKSKSRVILCVSHLKRWVGPPGVVSHTH